MFNLSGKKALVTGGSRGIGQGIVLALAEQGADICVNYHARGQEAMLVVKQVQKMGRESWSFQADVSSQDNVVVMFEEIKKKWGQLDILVNNAGILKFAPFEEITEKDWDQILAVNLKGQFLCAKQAMKLMKPGSKIINLASIASGGVGVGFPSIAHYTASKGGVVAMTETMAIELGVKGINVNAIAPGIIESDMTKEMLTDEKTKAGIMARLANKRPGTPKDIGAAAAFLASDEADYITGTVLYVDGGWLAA